MSIDRVNPTQLHHALVIKLRHHGDVLLTSPVFSSLKHIAPHCEIDALVYAETEPMLAGHPAIAQLHTVDRTWKRLGFAKQARAEWQRLSALRARNYDLLIHLTDHPRGALLSRLLKPRWAVAPQRPERLWQKSFTHLIPRQPAHRHMVEANHDALRRLGLPVTDVGMRLHFAPGAEAEARANELLSDYGLHDRAFIQLHPTSRWMFKAWAVESYASLIAALQERGFPVVVTAAPAPQEMAMAAAILAHCQIPPVDFSGQLTLKELGAVIAKARLFVGVDSMPMHIAAAMGTPTVALFGPSDESLWGPWRTAHRIVASDRHPCRPCGLDGCGGGKISECLSTLSVKQVLAACAELLA